MDGKICVNCRSPVKDLYKTYSSNVIKISECENCKEIADKYVELEDIIVFIDLALLQTTAYRHVLFNTNFQKYWKYSIILICIEAYLTWNNIFSLSGTTPSTPSRGSDGNGEKGFYISCIIVILEHLLLFVLIYAFMRLLKQGPSTRGRRLWKALTLANFSKLLFVPVMIWHETSLWELGVSYFLILSYSVLSMICSLSVISHLSRLRTTLLIITAMGIRRLLMNQLEPLVIALVNHFFY